MRILNLYDGCRDGLRNRLHASEYDSVWTSPPCQSHSRMGRRLFWCNFDLAPVADGI